MGPACLRPGACLGRHLAAGVCGCWRERAFAIDRRRLQVWRGREPWRHPPATAGQADWCPWDQRSHRADRHVKLRGYTLTSDGTVWAWGVASFGELGDGQDPSYSTRAVEVQFPAGVRIASLANPMPFDGALAIDSSGHVWGWGLNAIGDLCLSGLTALRPSELPLSGVSLATGARTHSLFYSGGTVYACGAGLYGVLGTGSTANSSTPVPVTGLPSTPGVVALTSSWEGSGALLKNGTTTTGVTTPPDSSATARPLRVPYRCEWYFPVLCDRSSRAEVVRKTARPSPSWQTARCGRGATTTEDNLVTAPGSVRRSPCASMFPMGCRSSR